MAGLPSAAGVHVHWTDTHTAVPGEGSVRFWVDLEGEPGTISCTPIRGYSV